MSATPGCVCMRKPGVNLGYHFSGALILDTGSVTGLDLSSKADWPVRPRITTLHHHGWLFMWVLEDWLGFLCLWGRYFTNWLTPLGPLRFFFYLKIWFFSRWMYLSWFKHCACVHIWKYSMGLLSYVQLEYFYISVKNESKESTDEKGQ